MTSLCARWGILRTIAVTEKEVLGKMRKQEARATYPGLLKCHGRLNSPSIMTGTQIFVQGESHVG